MRFRTLQSIFPRPNDKFIRERDSDTAKSIRDRQLEKPSDEAVEMKTLEVMEDEEEGNDPRRAKVERSASRKETVGEGSRRRRSEMRKKMREEMEGRDIAGEAMAHIAEAAIDEGAQGELCRVVQVDCTPEIFQHLVL